MKFSDFKEYRKTPYLVPGTTLVFKFFEGIPRYQIQPENFSNIFSSKNKVFRRVQIPKKNFF
jgi:hypothetical protein